MQGHLFDISAISLERHPTLSSSGAIKKTEAALQELNSFLGDNYLQNTKQALPEDEISDLNVCILSSLLSFAHSHFSFLSHWVGSWVNMRNSRINTKNSQKRLLKRSKSWLQSRWIGCFDDLRGGCQPGNPTSQSA